MTDTDDRRKNPSPPPVRRLFFANIAPGRPYHAALSATERAKAHGMRVTEHCHDFYEMLLVLAGEAVHGINGIETPLRAGDLILLRPDDRHYIRFQTGRHFYYINIAVDADMWHGFHTLTGAEKPLDAPIVRPAAVKTVPLAQDEPPDECAAAFRRALSLFQDQHAAPIALRTEMCRLLATVSLRLLDNPPDDTSDRLPDDAPPWLKAACQRVQEDANALREGLPAFVAEAGVTCTHLARVLKAATQQTPTEYINRLRIWRAARLLTTTTLPILDIAADCGFEQPAYFYRLFRARFHTSPHAYRVAAARCIAPNHSPN